MNKEELKELFRKSDEVKKLIQDRLDDISDLDDRRMLRGVLNSVFSGIIDYNADMYVRLEKRIFDEIVDPLEEFFVYTSIEDIDKIDPIDNFLHPMVKEDLEREYDLEQINESLQNGEPVVLATIYMKCSFTTLARLFKTERTYSGYIKTDKEVYEISVHVKQSMRYIDKIKELYKIFQKNGKSWSTINCPYAYKFVDIVVNAPLALKQGEAIKEITVDLAEYEQYKVPNVIPLWNIKQVKAKDAEFPEESIRYSIENYLESVKATSAPEPMPVVDAIIYDHKIALENYGIENGFMIALDSADYIYSRRTKDQLIIESNDSKKSNWDLLQIENAANIGKRTFSYEVLTNARDYGFSGKLSAVKSLVIRTRAEISRVLSYYRDLSSQLKFDDEDEGSVKILDEYNKTIETFDFNGFIDDNIRKDSHKKIMLLTFVAANRNDYLLKDKMSFLVSEIQFLFPEYKCIGELI